MQTDWGKIKTNISVESKNIYFIVNTLGYSRKFHFCGTDRLDTEHTYEGIALAFKPFGRVTQEVSVNNQKTAVLSNIPGNKTIFNKRFVDFQNIMDLLQRLIVIIELGLR